MGWVILMCMHAPETPSVETLDARFLRAVEAFCEHRNMSGRAFGDAALGDPGFVSSLRRGRSPCVSTLDPVLEFMGDAPLGPAFRREVETYLSITGLKRSVLGARAMGNPSFVSQLFGGLSPTLRTVHKVRQWMQAHASAAEWRRIRRRAPPMPVLLSAMPEKWPFPVTEFGTESDADATAARVQGGNSYRYKGGCLDTRAAAARAGLKPGTLASYRVRGGGPVFLRVGGAVRYALDDLEAWIAGRRRGAHHRAV